jgi:uncharacterized protein (DUF58 family)
MIFLAVWLPLCGAVTINNFLIMIFGMTVGLGFISHRLARRNIDSVAVSRKLPSEIFAGTRFTVLYEAETSLKRGGAYTLRLSENPPMEGSEGGVECFHVRPGEKSTGFGSCTIERRGEHRIGAGILRSAFPFGLATYERSLWADQRVLVFPRIEPITADAAMCAQGSGTNVERTGLFGTVPYRLRDYVSGDPRRHIDWKKSARTGELISRDLSEEVSGEILIRLPSDATEEAISRAASLVVHFGKRGIPVSLEAPGISVEPGTGPRFVRKLLTILALWDGSKAEVSTSKRCEGTISEVERSGESSLRQPGEAYGRCG